MELFAFVVSFSGFAAVLRVVVRIITQWMMEDNKEDGPEWSWELACQNSEKIGCLFLYIYVLIVCRFIWCPLCVDVCRYVTCVSVFWCSLINFRWVSTTHDDWHSCPPRNVQHIAASKGAFAGIRADGKVVTWGSPGYGGDSSNLDSHKSLIRVTLVL